MSKIYPVILSGGNGTRLWPLSRSSYPKQLLPLITDESMLQVTLRRAKAINNVQAPLIICNSEHRFLVSEQCSAIGIEPGAIYLEPVGRNTAPAIALAALHLAASDPDAVMLVMPADHCIDGIENFLSAVQTASLAAQEQNLVTFGIVPTHPETGYGYIETGTSFGNNAGVHKVKSFVEKPDRNTAIAYLEHGGFLWNSGMFVFTASSYLEELQSLRPDIFNAVTQAWQKRTVDMGFIRPNASDFIACPAESIDYAIMQPTQRATVVTGKFVWNDVGSWDALWDISDKDTFGNHTKGDTYLSETTNSYVRAESRLVSVLGLDDVIVIESKDAVLVMRKGDSQNIRGAIKYFEKAGRKEHIDHVRTHRPWGWYEGVDRGERFQVKRILVKPGEKLSLQMHHHRAEHWIVVSGTAKVRVEEKEILLTENQSTYIPLGHVHCLENPGKVDLILIEVQSGQYLGEDDIVRLSDRYGR